ncbi:hypothetical protein Y1Q_0000587 [Alligator mississippiensis]|uniref:Uncharacterized protein n=1 Tax=Alligator mississippiensis TaxID=8496 RepID=A0A151MBM9_ALLMI|nr:hypothetical protein Y1Q_0000587 [Alligator mississippiensis]
MEDEDFTLQTCTWICTSWLTLQSHITLFTDDMGCPDTKPCLSGFPFWNMTELKWRIRIIETYLYCNRHWNQKRIPQIFLERGPGHGA